MNTEEINNQISELPNKFIDYIGDIYNNSPKEWKLSDIESYGVLYLWFGMDVQSALIKLSLIAFEIFSKYKDNTSDDSWDKLITEILESEHKEKLLKIAFYDVAVGIYINLFDKMQESQTDSES